MYATTDSINATVNPKGSLREPGPRSVSTHRLSSKNTEESRDLDLGGMVPSRMAEKLERSYPAVAASIDKMPKSGYGVIYADPPWRFRNYSAKGEGRNAIAHYDCLPFSELARLPVAKLAAKDAVLFLWATDPLLPQALELIDAWGFTFKTVAFYWSKLNRRANPTNMSCSDFYTGLGYWTRANTEQCLLATRGKPRRYTKGVRRLIVSPRREHSRKPDEVYDRIERLVEGPYLELFSRASRKGWHSCGDQLGLFDRGAVRTRRIPSKNTRHKTI